MSRRVFVLTAAGLAFALGAVAWATWSKTSSRHSTREGQHLRLGFDVLSSFKYDHYEVINDVDGGRPFTRSDDVIPPQVKAYDGKLVVIHGFLMPLRLRKGLVTEFLLFRDQAACCFGERAKMNHYIRVKLNGPGFPPTGVPTPYKVYGRLAVGEILVQGYLTGIYEMEATRVERTN